MRDMKRLGLIAAGLVAAFSLNVASAVKFSDVPPGHWAEEAVYKLAEEGIILGFPDGTYRGNEFLTRYQAALLIYRLLERLRAEFGAGVDKEALAALRNAVQELAAELASLGVRVAALEDNAATKDDIAKLKECIEKLKAAQGLDPAALEELAAKAEAAAAKADEALALAEANADSIKALNELAVMLNQDVLSLQDRVAALEKQVLGFQVSGGEKPVGFAKASDLKVLTEYMQALAGDVSGLAGKVSELESKVAAVEKGAFTISGTLSLTYRSVEAQNFKDYDLDRLFWKSKNVFSTGDGDEDGQKVDEAEGLENTKGKTTAELSVTFKTGKFTASSKDGKLNTYENLFQFSIVGEWTDPEEGASASTFALNVDKVSTTLAIAKDQTLSVVFGQSVNAKFTEYVFDNDANSYGHGLVAKLKGLPLGATLTFAYGNHKPGEAYDYFYAARVQAPIAGFTVGASYVKQDTLAKDILGFDAKGKLGPVSVSGEYFTDGAGGTSYYVKGAMEIAKFSVEGNYRNIADTVTSANLASSDADFADGSDYNKAPFRADQQGFGIQVKGTLGILAAKLHYDAYKHAGNDYTELGASLETALGAILLKGGYSRATENGTAADSIPGVAPGQTYSSKICAKAEHKGDSDFAFIKNLNFTIKYVAYTVSGTKQFFAYGDYSRKFGPFDVLLFGGYFLTDMDAGESTVKYGIKAESDPFALPLKPALAFGYVSRSSTGGSSETKYFAGVKFKEFFLPHSEFRAGYSVYAAKGVESILVGKEDHAFDAVPDYLYIYSPNGSVDGKLEGVLLSWTYYDLTATFLSAKDQDGNFAKAFQISYEVGF